MGLVKKPVIIGQFCPCYIRVCLEVIHRIFKADNLHIHFRAYTNSFMEVPFQRSPVYSAAIRNLYYADTTL